MNCIKREVSCRCILLNYSEPLVAKRSMNIRLANGERIEGMAGIGAAPPRAAAGMGEGRALGRRNLSTAELKYVAIHIV